MHSPLTAMRTLFTSFEYLAQSPMPNHTLVDTIEILRSTDEYDPSGGAYTDLIHIVSETIAILDKTGAIELAAKSDFPDFERPVIEALASLDTGVALIPDIKDAYTPPGCYDAIDLVLKVWAIKHRSWPSAGTLAIHGDIIKSNLFTDGDRSYMEQQALERRRRLISASLQGNYFIAGIADDIELVGQDPTPLADIIKLHETNPVS